jgi:hypothetical protein
MEAKPLRDLRADIPFVNREAPKPRAQRKYFWIDEDPDLAPAARRETPLTAWV